MGVKQILVVEDNPPLRELWTESITRAGYGVVAAVSAADAYARLATLRPDLILLDLVMPSREINGVELLARLHENPAWTNIPVLIVSGIADSVDRQGAAALGVRNILSKPVDLSTLLGEIARLTGRSLRDAPRGGAGVANPQQQGRPE
jgi:CheY-like chemotaxis protein